MGLAVGDYMNNGLVDVLDTDFSDDYKALYRNDRQCQFYRRFPRGGDRSGRRSLCGLG